MMEDRPDEQDYHVFLELTWLEAHDAMCIIDRQDNLTDGQKRMQGMCHHYNFRPRKKDYLRMNDQPANPSLYPPISTATCTWHWWFLEYGTGF